MCEHIKGLRWNSSCTVKPNTKLRRVHINFGNKQSHITSQNCLWNMVRHGSKAAIIIIIMKSPNLWFYLLRSLLWNERNVCEDSAIRCNVSCFVQTCMPLPWRQSLLRGRFECHFSRITFCYFTILRIAYAAKPFCLTATGNLMPPKRKPFCHTVACCTRDFTLIKIETRNAPLSVGWVENGG